MHIVSLTGKWILHWGEGGKMEQNTGFQIKPSRDRHEHGLAGGTGVRKVPAQGLLAVASSISLSLPYSLAHGLREIRASETQTRQSVNRFGKRRILNCGVK